jgi:hypothetical protein
MSHFGGPIGKKPDDPLSKYYEIRHIQALEEESRKQDQRRRSKIKTLSLYLLRLLKTIITTFLSKYLYREEKKKIQETLLLMQKHFRILMKEDRSQDVIYLQHLSDNWRNMLEQSLELRKATPFTLSIKNFIKTIAKYPEHQEHTFAYYLTEYTGPSWLPFPYMELIQHLHLSYEKDPINNPLTHWSNAISAMLKQLNKNYLK